MMVLLPVTSCFVIMAFLSLREIRLSPDNLLESLVGAIMNEVHICVSVSIVLTCISSRLFPAFIFLRGRRVNRLSESFMFQNTLKRLSCRRCVRRRRKNIWNIIKGQSLLKVKLAIHKTQIYSDLRKC